jgi:hypothetical protein
MEEDKANVNSELRYLALELTKMAHQQNKSFSKVADEYVGNVYKLESVLKSSSEKMNYKSNKKSRQRA